MEIYVLSRVTPQRELKRLKEKQLERALTFSQRNFYHSIVVFNINTFHLTFNGI